MESVDISHLNYSILSSDKSVVNNISATSSITNDNGLNNLIDATKAQGYILPQKLVKNMRDITKWDKSEAYYDLMGFINSVSTAMQGKKLSYVIEEISPVITKLLEILKKLEDLARDTPPIEQPQRFGNSAFRCWYQKMRGVTLGLIQDLLPEDLVRAAPELEPYLYESFGNQTRIDYGTGHELSFVMFLMCLFKLGVLKRSDELAIGIKVFNTYINFARKLQVTYRMEPAGSHGVWSLDDYQFIPFIWGSAQLVDSELEPHQFVEDNIIDKHKDEYMFISCIHYIRQVKTGHFAEHSNQLWSISAVQSWSKINSGLVKMYQKELLSKFPIIQHVLFGSLLTLNPVARTTLMPNVRLGIKAPIAPMSKSIDIPLKKTETIEVLPNIAK